MEAKRRSGPSAPSSSRPAARTRPTGCCTRCARRCSPRASRSRASSRSLPDAIEALLLLGRLPEADAFCGGWKAGRGGSTGRRPSPPPAAAAGYSRPRQGTRRPRSARSRMPHASSSARRLPVRARTGAVRPRFVAAPSPAAPGGARHAAGRARALRPDRRPALQEKTRAELGRIGGRSASPGELTPTEQRIAELVAGGMTNREVASALVITVHTVEAALTSIYRKLDVRSRTEMARKLPGLA